MARKGAASSVSAHINRTTGVSSNVKMVLGACIGLMQDVLKRVHQHVLVIVLQKETI